MLDNGSGLASGNLIFIDNGNALPNAKDVPAGKFLTWFIPSWLIFGTILATYSKSLGCCIFNII